MPDDRAGSVGDPLSYYEIGNPWLQRVTGPVDAFAGIPAEDRARVFRAALELVPEVERAIRPYPVVFGEEAPTASRVNQLTLSWVAKCPDADRRLVIDMVVLYLMLFAFDDVMDGPMGDFSVPQLDTFVEECIAVVRDPGARVASERAAGPLRQTVEGFREVSARFLAYPAARHHYSYFSTLMCRSFLAMGHELHWQRGVVEWPSSYAEYLRCGAISVFVPPMVGALLTTVGPLSPVEAHRAQLDTLAQLNGMFIRLMNDLRSVERDSHEHVPNAVPVLARELGLSQEAAAEEVLRRALSHATAIEEALDSLPAEFERLADALRRNTRIHRHWYLAREIHGLPTSELVMRARGDV